MTVRSLQLPGANGYAEEGFLVSRSFARIGCFFFRFYWLKVRALCESHNWGQLEIFAKSRKSLIGYEVNQIL